MRRRELVLLVGGLVTASRMLCAQQQALPVIGYLSSFSPPSNLSDLSRNPFHQGLCETGFVESQNVVFEYRWAEGHYDRLPALAADLVSRKVDLIATNGGTPPALAAKAATSTIPIVFTHVSDPVGMRLVVSLARPGGNLTGFANITTELMAKRLELLSELVPQARVIALLVNPNNAYTDPMIPVVQEAARAKGLQLHPEGQHRRRDRRRLRGPRSTARRWARRRRRAVLLQPARAAGGAGFTPCRSGDL